MLFARFIIRSHGTNFFFVLDFTAKHSSPPDIITIPINDCGK